MIEKTEKGEIPMKNTFKIQLNKDSSTLYFSSNFDSGNLEKVQIGPNNMIYLTPAHDCAGSGIQSHAKGWFYFSIKGASIHTKLKLVVKKMTQLSSQNKISEYFKPVFRYQNQQWQRCQCSRAITKEDDTELHIQFEVLKLQTIFFAFTFPFSYQENETFLQKLSTEAKKIKNIFYEDQTLILSSQKRKIHLITITSHEEKDQHQQFFDEELLFPEKIIKKINKFSSDKKVVIISARVHPAQTPSSHTFNGLIKFLLSKDARAHLLRKNFVFKLIPMLNPDGVANGHYRMDIFGQNLNRFYQSPNSQFQPSAYAVKKIGSHYFKQNKLCFYLDLHAHPQRKGNFIYGNAFQNLESQAQTRLFPKILSLNTIQFDYDYSSFDQKHMTLKDKNENLTKQGCGRVVFQKQFNLAYSYTMECGYTCSTGLNQIVAIEKSNRKFEKLGIITDEMQNIKSQYYANTKKNVYFTIKAYQNLGKNIAVSILDLFQLNPASRLPNTQYKTIQNLRKQLLSNLQNASNQTNFRKYVLKPFSQQSLKPNSKKSESQKQKNKTISSNVSIPLKEQTGLNQVLKQKVFIPSKQFLFLDSNKGQIERSKKGTTIETNRQKVRNPTLPKVNLFRLGNMLRKTDQGKYSKARDRD